MTTFNYLNISATALKSHSRALAAISNNIANVNTEGFKAGEVRFEDLVGQYSKNNQIHRTHGVNHYYKQPIEQEGTFETIGSSLDIALNGIGMFVTSPNKEMNATNIELTDNGRLQLLKDPDHAIGSTEAADFYLADMKGNYMLGWPYDAATDSFTTGEGIDSLTPLIVGGESIFVEALATTEAALEFNLDANSTGATDTTIADIYSFGIEIFDGSGPEDEALLVRDDAQTFTSTFTKLVGTNEWELNFSLENGSVDQDPILLKFDSLGAIESMTMNVSEDPEIIDYQTVVDENFNLPLSIKWDAQEELQTLTVNFSAATQFGDRVSSLTDYEVDGNEIGYITGHFFNDDGVLMGQFDNGKDEPLGKLAVGDVVAMNSLTPINSTHFITNEASGNLRLYQIDQTDRVDLIPDYFEGSTTEIANEFTKMIVVQRAYSSAATTLRTADEMLQTVTQIR